MLRWLDCTTGKLTDSRLSFQLENPGVLQDVLTWRQLQKGHVGKGRERDADAVARS